MSTRSFQLLRALLVCPLSEDCPPHAPLPGPCGEWGEERREMTTCHGASRHLDPSARQRHLRGEGVTRRNNYSLLSTGLVQRETSSANKGSVWAPQCGLWGPCSCQSTRSVVVVVVHRFDITALFSAVEQTHCTLVACDSQ